MPVSKVWNYFCRPFNGHGGLKVRCLQCKEELTYKHSTKSMLNHAKLKHQIDIPVLPPRGGRKKRTFTSSFESDSEDEEMAEDNPEPQQPPSKKTRQSDADRPEASSACPAERQYSGPLDKCLNSVNAFAVGAHRDAQCTNALIFMIAKDGMPLSTPDKVGFRTFVKTLQPLYKIPCETTVTRLLEEKYTVLKGRVKEWIREARNITLTMDLWTHKHAMRGYLGVTAHFRRGKEQVSVELCARLMDERKTKENLKIVMREVCDDWGIVPDEQVRAVVTDGGANIKAAVKEFFGVEKHISCLAHQLNGIGQILIGNTVRPAPSEVDPTIMELEPEDEEDFDVDREEAAARGNSVRELIVKVKKIVRFFKQSEVATSRLLAIQRDEEGKTDSTCLKLIQEVRTRWNSCFDMIDRYLLLAPTVSRILVELRSNRRATKATVPTILEPEEEEVLRELRDLLAPLARATKEISFEKTVTLSKCIPLLKTLKRDIEKYQATTPIAFNLKAQFLNLLNEKFANIEGVKVYAVSTLLDPRFKRVGFTDDDRAPIRISNAISTAGRLVKSKMEEAANAAQAEQARPPAEGAAEQQEDDFWGEFDREVQHYSMAVAGQDMPGGLPIQLRMFLDSPLVKRAENPDPMVAWETLKSEYNFVYLVAEEYLCILATSVPSERLFSHAGQIATPLRTRLSGKHLNMLVFLKSCNDSLWFS